MGAALLSLSCLQAVSPSAAPVLSKLSLTSGTRGGEETRGGQWSWRSERQEQLGRHELSSDGREWAAQS